MPHNSGNRLSGSNLSLGAQGYLENDSGERPARTAYIRRKGYSFLHTTARTRREPYPTHPRQRSNVGYDLEVAIEAHNNRRRQRLSATNASPEPQSASVGQPSVGEVTRKAVVAASVHACSAAQGPYQGHVPHTSTPSYSRDVHQSSLFRHPALANWGPDRVVPRAPWTELDNRILAVNVPVIDSQQRPSGNNLFVLEANAEFGAGGYISLEASSRLGSLGNRENPIVIENSPPPERVASPVFPSPIWVPSPFSATSSFSDASTSSEGDGAHLSTPNDLAPLDFDAYIFPLSSPTPNPENSSTSGLRSPESGTGSSGYILTTPQYFSNTPTIPAPPGNTSNFTTDNSPISSPPRTTSFEYWPTSPGDYDYTAPQNASTFTAPYSSAYLLLEPYPTPSASSRTTSSSQWGIEPSNTDLVSPIHRQLLSRSESIRSRCGYDEGSEGYPSQSTMYSDDEEAEDGSEEGDMIDQEAKPEESPEVWLRWVEVMADRGSEQEEDAEAQE
ncbi:hypothetical protein EV426DRAFT_679605 [Tirmania nivea]|nr:hypothetical protein EV426DRAFT_679605 [Tirmania nivea]